MTRAELVGDGLGIVAVPRQLRLEVVDAGRQHAVDDAEADRLHAGGEPGLKRFYKMVPDLQRGPYSSRESTTLFRTTSIALFGGCFLIGQAGFRSRLLLRRSYYKVAGFPSPKAEPRVRLNHKRVVAVHFPKSSGSSLRFQFTALLGSDFALDDVHDPLVCTSRRGARFPRDKRMVMGHFHAGRYQTTDAFRMTFLREPVDNLISIYYFWQGLLDHGHPVHRRFLCERPHITDFARHPAIRDLLSETYFGGINLDQFDFIGFYETRDTDFGRLSVQLGVPLRPDLHHNQTPLSEERQALATQPTLRGQLTDLLVRDVALYWKLRQRTA